MTTQYDIDELIYQMERDDWHPAIQQNYMKYLHSATPPYLDVYDWMESLGTSEIGAMCSEYHDKLRELNPNLIEPRSNQ